MTDKPKLYLALTDRNTGEAVVYASLREFIGDDGSVHYVVPTKQGEGPRLYSVQSSAQVLRMTVGTLQGSAFVPKVWDSPTGQRHVTLLPSQLVNYEKVFTHHDVMALNPWCIDPPNYPVENITSTAVEVLAERVMKQLTLSPYKFYLATLQRRYLWYCSDGNFDSQSGWIGAVRTADSSSSVYKSFMTGELDMPNDKAGQNDRFFTSVEDYKTGRRPQYGRLVPLIWHGPAWCLRFLVRCQPEVGHHSAVKGEWDGAQEFLWDGCRIYVDDEGNFLCSDWCQREDLASKSQGISLQVSRYDLLGWLLRSGLHRAMARYENGISDYSKVKVQASAHRRLVNPNRPHPSSTLRQSSVAWNTWTAEQKRRHALPLKSLLADFDSPLSFRKWIRRNASRLSASNWYPGERLKMKPKRRLLQRAMWYMVSSHINPGSYHEGVATITKACQKGMLLVHARPEGGTYPGWWTITITRRGTNHETSTKHKFKHKYEMRTRTPFRYVSFDCRNLRIQKRAADVADGKYREVFSRIARKALPESLPQQLDVTEVKRLLGELEAARGLARLEVSVGATLKGLETMNNKDGV